MRRWNGWGDDTVEYPLPVHGIRLLKESLGFSKAPRDITLQEIVPNVPNTRLLPHPLISVDSADRIRHACGQSLPDWIALRSGNIPAFPDGVAYPDTDEQVDEMIHYAQKVGACIIPFGGGTSVVGHINPQKDGPPVLTIDLHRMNRLLHFDEISRLATFGAGVTGPDLEAQLRVRGYTLGHFPQSFEYSTLGGWISTRSSGQQSLGYGRIENLFAGGTLISPSGVLIIPTFPASAAGPDIREMVLGSEGRLGILSEITVRISTLPEREQFDGFFLPDFDNGQNTARQILQAGLPLSMIRLGTATETITTLAMSGHQRAVNALQKMLSIRGLTEEKCLMLLGFTGRKSLVRAAYREALRIVHSHGGIHVGQTFGKQWHRHRFRTPYLRNSLWEIGYVVDTVETATTWSNISPMINAIESSLHNGLADIDERVRVLTHLSHVYKYGSSIYTTFIFRNAPDPNETLRRWQVLKDAVSQAIVRYHGTISHQHGVGQDHLPYLEAEKGVIGLETIRDLCSRFDPNGIMNPGKLVL